ncbi:L,D-transpeptidase [Patescibacteria group bacterium]|nr:L,D-transpeptidase [Patescibacteria group bacterium]MBU1029141.1 L,D-transpeptidase [Patescibacteria group bacterium]MBU1916129.1 L,D-transpeptidase [Patescibacteria group bacterium]
MRLKQKSWLTVSVAVVAAASVFNVFGIDLVAAAVDTDPPSLSIDSDNDGLSDAQETEIYFTDPVVADTDGDGYSDGVEIAAGYSPRHTGGLSLMQVDSDNDYLLDAWELILGTGLMNPDSDGDLYLDGTEVAASYDPLNPSPHQLEKLIRVNRYELKLTYSFDGKVFGSFPISTGKVSTPTPKGDFTVLAKIPVKHYAGVGWDYPNTKWNLQFARRNGLGYYIHGAYWHNKFGVKAVSSGCVNVRYEDMEPLYWWAQEGTKIIIE